MIEYRKCWQVSTDACRVYFYIELYPQSWGWYFTQLTTSQNGDVENFLISCFMCSERLYFAEIAVLHNERQKEIIYSLLLLLMLACRTYADELTGFWFQETGWLQTMTATFWATPTILFDVQCCQPRHEQPSTRPVCTIVSFEFLQVFVGDETCPGRLSYFWRNVTWTTIFSNQPKRASVHRHTRTIFDIQNLVFWIMMHFCWRKNLKMSGIPQVPVSLLLL
jgi:hypothetical protein